MPSGESAQMIEVLQDQECLCDGERFSQPARVSKWVEFEPVETTGEIHEDLNSGFRKVVSRSGKMRVKVRILPTDPWITNHWREAWGKQNKGEKVPFVYMNKNPDRKRVMQSSDVAIPQYRPEFAAGNTDLNEIELTFEGVFTEQEQSNEV